MDTNENQYSKYNQKGNLEENCDEKEKLNEADRFIEEENKKGLK